jgi:hypothetical protein
MFGVVAETEGVGDVVLELAEGNPIRVDGVRGLVG